MLVQEAVADSLEELWISYNLIEKLKGIQCMKKLRVLYMSNNLVKEWGEPRSHKYTQLQMDCFVSYHCTNDGCVVDVLNPHRRPAEL